MSNENCKDEKELYQGCDHEHGEDCGCGQDTITITFDDNEEVECNIIGVFEAEGAEYIAVNPIESDEVLLYRYKEADEGVNIEFIDSDEEYNKVTAVFYEMIEDEDGFAEYEEYITEDEDE